jgi:hypothetical protein
MREYTLKTGGLICVSVVLLLLTLSNVLLAVVSVREHRRNVQLTDPGSQGMPEGANVPVLTGNKLSSKEPWRVMPAGTAAMFLLVYRDGCHYCEQNWPAWEKLFGGSSTHASAVVLTSDKAVRPDYEATHPLLDRRLTLYSLDTTHVGALNLNLTPQTILVRNGRVERDWVGVLSSNDIAQITKSIASLH